MDPYVLSKLIDWRLQDLKEVFKDFTKERFCNLSIEEINCLISNKDEQAKKIFMVLFAAAKEDGFKDDTEYEPTNKRQHLDNNDFNSFHDDTTQTMVSTTAKVSQQLFSMNNVSVETVQSHKSQARVSRCVEALASSRLSTNQEESIVTSLEDKQKHFNERDYESFYSQGSKNKSLYKILADPKNLIGNMLLYMYSQTQQFDKEFENLLGMQILSNAMTYTRNKRRPFFVDSKKLEDLAEEVTAIFVKEVKEYYYDVGYTINAEYRTDYNFTSNRQASGGVLQVSYMHIRGLLRKIELLPPKQYHSINNRSKDKQTVETDLSIFNTKIDEIEDKNEKANKITQIIDAWKNTQDYRFTIVKGHGLTQVLQTFAVLDSSIAQVLIDYDFENKFTISPSIFKAQWTIISRKIIALFIRENYKQYNEFNASEDIDNFLKDYEEILIEHEEREDKLYLHDDSDIVMCRNVHNILHTIEGQNEVVAFLILHKLIDYTVRTPHNLNKKRKAKVQSEKSPSSNTENSENVNDGVLDVQNSVQWKPKKKDVLPSFIQNLKNHEYLENFREEIKSQQKERNTKDQPLVVICGPLNESTCCHVLHDDVKFDFEDSVEAVSFVVKMLLILKLKHPLACPHIYGFFIHHVFNLKGQAIYGKSQILSLVNRLNKI